MNTIDITGFFRAGIVGTPTASYSSVQAALTLGLVRRSDEPGYIILANGMKLSAKEAIKQGMMDEEAAQVIAAEPGASIAAPHTRVDHKHVDDVIAATPPAYQDTPAGAVVEALLALIAAPGSRDAAEGFAGALEVAISAPRKKA